MKHFQVVVNLSPDDVMRRLAASIDQPSLSRLMNPFGGKDFYGQLSGYQFWLRSRRRWSRNSFAPICRGNVIPNGSDSTINFPLFVIAFFSGFFCIVKQMGKSDERSLTYFLENLFRDVIVQPAQFAQPIATTR